MTGDRAVDERPSFNNRRKYRDGQVRLYRSLKSVQIAHTKAMDLGFVYSAVWQYQTNVYALGVESRRK
jgi:hypothetical protein